MPSFNPSDIFKTPIPEPELPAHLQFEAAELLRQIETALAEGLPCYLRCGDVSFHVVPEDPRHPDHPRQPVEETIYQAFNQTDFVSGSVNLVHEPEGAITLENSTFAPGVKVKIVDHNQEHRVFSKLQTLVEAEAYVACEYGEALLAKNTGQHYHFFYSRAIDALSPRVPWEQVERLILPLFNELEDRHLISAIEDYLGKRGLSDRQIALLKCRKVDPERLQVFQEKRRLELKATFIEETGIHPDQIRTRHELIQATDTGTGPRLWLVTCYVFQLYNPSELVLRQVVAPLLRLGDSDVVRRVCKYLFRIGREDLVDDKVRGDACREWSSAKYHLGVKPETIKSGAELEALLLKQRNNFHQSYALSEYLLWLEYPCGERCESPDEEILRSVVVPLLHSPITGIPEKVYEFIRYHHRTDLLSEQVYHQMESAFKQKRAREKAAKERRDGATGRKDNSDLWNDSEQ